MDTIKKLLSDYADRQKLSMAQRKALLKTTEKVCSEADKLLREAKSEERQRAVAYFLKAAKSYK